MVDAVANPMSKAGTALVEPSTQPSSGKSGLHSWISDLLAQVFYHQLDAWQIFEN